MNDLLSFSDRFATTQAMAFSDLWCLTDTMYERYEFMEMLQVHMETRDGAVDATWEEMLPSSCAERLKGYRARFHSVVAAHPANIVEFSFDLDHNPFARPRASREIRPRPEQLGTLISHGCIWHESHRRPLLAAEWLLGQGICPSKQLAQTLKTRVPVDMWGLITSGAVSTSCARSMAGNAWNVPTFGCYVMFLLASLELKNRHQKIKRLHVATVEPDDDDDDIPVQPTKKIRRQSSWPTVSYD